MSRDERDLSHVGIRLPRETQRWVRAKALEYGLTASEVYRRLIDAGRAAWSDGECDTAA